MALVFVRGFTKIDHFVQNVLEARTWRSKWDMTFSRQYEDLLEESAPRSVKHRYQIRRCHSIEGSRFYVVLTGTAGQAKHIYQYKNTQKKKEITELK
jgi:hypothetical protein